MIYPLANRSGQGRLFSPRRLFAVILIIIFLAAGVVFYQNFTDFFTAAARPFWLAGDYLSEKLYGKNRQLEQTLAVLEAELASYKLLAEDLKLLRQDYGLRPGGQGPLIARVISDHRQNPYDVLVVDLGQENRSRDFAVGDLVRVRDSVLLGKVIEINKSSSKVQLFSAPGTEIPVVIGPKDVPALATGRGGGNFTISLPRSLEINVSDPVTVPSLGVGALLGTVGSVDNDPANSFQTVYSRVPLNLSALKYVAIYPR